MLHCRKGFTLLEVMIAMAILAIALSAVYSSQSQSIAMAGNSRFATTAALLAQSKMVECEIMAPGKLHAASGDFGKDFPDYAWRVDITQEEAYLERIDVTVTNTRLTENNTFLLSLYLPAATR